MENEDVVKSKKISLGFTDQKFEPGVHICQIYDDEDERHNALVDYVISGLEGGENTACFTEKETDVSVSKRFSEAGISYDEVTSSGMFSLSETQGVYFEGDEFDPNRMLGILNAFYEGSVDKNYTGARAIGEMVNKIESIEGGSQWFEYESKVNMLIKKYPVNIVCQFDARAFKGSTIMEILKVHQYMIVKGSVVHNPFYVEPEEYLANIKSVGTTMY